jgi:hypothetical protein
MNIRSVSESFMRNIDDFQIGDDFMSANDIERHEQKYSGCEGEEFS